MSTGSTDPKQPLSSMVIPGELAKRCCQQAVNAALTMAFTTFGQVAVGIEEKGDDEALALVPGIATVPGNVVRPQVIRIPAGGSLAVGGAFLIAAGMELEAILRQIGNLAFSNQLVGTSNAVEQAVRKTIEANPEAFNCGKCIRTYALRQFPNRRRTLHTAEGETIQART